MVGYLFSIENKYEYLDRHVKEQLIQRGPWVDSIWDFDKSKLVKEVNEIYGDRLWGMDCFFIPEDPCELLGQVLTGDLIELEILLDVEDRFGIKISKEEQNKIFDSTYGYFIDFISKQTNSR